MENKFKILGLEEEKKLTEKELIKYYIKLQEYLSTCEYNNFSEKGIIVREKLNILIKKILKKIIRYDVVIDGYENIPQGPTIYASSHQEFNDVINSIYAYPEHTLTLNASNISWVLKQLLNINGVIYVDRDSKESRRTAKIEMEKSLAKGKSINMYPEATWNCTPSKLHLPFYIGMIDIAKRMNVPVVPVVQEYTYDETILDGKSHIKSVHIRFGRPIYVTSNDDIIGKLEEFDEVFSTIRWELIEEKGTYPRKKISNKLYTNYIKARINDWKIPGNDIYEERKQIYSANDDFYLFNHVNDIDFDESDNLLPTEYVRKLIAINKEHLR